jgi:hypothetical protein
MLVNQNCEPSNKNFGCPFVSFRPRKPRRFPTFNPILLGLGRRRSKSSGHGRYGQNMHRAGSNAVIGPGKNQMSRIIIRLMAVGALLILQACSTPAIDILCPPAGQCPNVHGWHGGGDEG